MAFARLRSVELGYRGLLELHSLSNVEGSYQRLNMPDYGHEPDKDGLAYFKHGLI